MAWSSALGKAMRRRDFIKSIAGSAAVWPLGAGAQQPRKIARIGFLGGTSASRLGKPSGGMLRVGLRDLGYVEGGNLTIDYRWAEGQYERLPELVAELVRLNVDVIVTHGTPGSVAAKKVTTNIPIVVALSGDLVAAGIVASIARPGGNITGQSFFAPELNGKRIQLLKEMAPQMIRVATIVNPDDAVQRTGVARDGECRPVTNDGPSIVPSSRAETTRERVFK